MVNLESADKKDDTEVGENKSYGTLADEDEACFMDIKLLYEVGFFLGVVMVLSDDASNVTMIGKDKSDDTLAYDDMAHKVILRTSSYVLKIVTHIGQVWS